MEKKKGCVSVRGENMYVGSVCVVERERAHCSLIGAAGFPIQPKAWSVLTIK